MNSLCPLPLLAILQGNAVALAASLFAGISLTIVVWWVVQALRTSDLEQEDEWRYDVSRINQLRKQDTLYRLFQPVIRFFAKLNRAAFRDRLPEIQRQILVSGLSRFWLPEEYLARMQLIALLLFPFYLFTFYRFAQWEGLFWAALFTGVTVWILRRRLKKRAQRRLTLIKRRMPFLLDLLTLLMEAGSSFIHSLQQSVAEFEGHPVSGEFAKVLSDMNMGKARIEAFENMRDRLSDDEITAIVGAITQSEQLGTPLSSIFRTQSDVLQLKRSQRAETIAGEAGVNMLLPGLLVMAATILIILGPFILSFLNNGMGL